MILAIIITAVSCSVLFVGSIYLLIWGDKPEPPTWESYLNNNKKHWRKK